MIPRTNALLICVVFLCGLEETVLSGRGHCTGNQCFALFQKPDDFLGAQEICKTFDGQLFVFNLEHLRKILRSSPNGLSGSYWLELHSAGRTTEEAVAGLQNCSYISGQNSTVLWKPCRENLDGFLCQYTFEENCSILQAGGGAQMKYTAHMGFEVNDSETFPLGTIAEKAGGKYPDSRYLCYSNGWLRAPWNCEVLRGGCEYNCNSTTHTCTCPAGQTLHPNNITCTTDPCADCAHECQQVGDNYVCTCREGFELAQDMKLCVDVDECKKDPCTGEGEECVNTQGGFECRCKDGFEEEDGVCEDVAICEKCEHMWCQKFNGVYKCVCKEGFRVSPLDPTKCEQHCTERDCPANCVENQCFCPDGYIQDSDDGIPICTDINECDNEQECDHKCENLFGGYRCLCNEGFKLHNEHRCLPTSEEEEAEGSGSPSPFPTPAGAHPAAVPSYIKTGSVLGITVFMVLCAALLFYLIQSTAKRCGKFQLSSFKHPNIDIFYLQQVTTETYKRLSFDKQLKNDFQIPSSHL
ncbi:thrombomodulin-like [Micropterus salmoides]|uniref:thrombomodulin-like n=1 Tax=Micropterus salmoides TaxID=27706 RepID=UPI0018EBD920|nr:thrombomodulin-like [Micropterus salmoides]